VEVVEVRDRLEALAREVRLISLGLFGIVYLHRNGDDTGPLIDFATQVEDKPQASGLARHQAERSYRVTNLRGETVTLDELHRQALRQLNGRRDAAQVAETLLGSLKAGELVLQRDSDKSKVTDEAEMRRLLGPALDKVLANLAKKALLVAPRG